VREAADLAADVRGPGSSFARPHPAAPGRPGHPHVQWQRVAPTAGIPCRVRENPSLRKPIFTAERHGPCGSGGQRWGTVGGAEFTRTSPVFRGEACLREGRQDEAIPAAHPFHARAGHPSGTRPVGAGQHVRGEPEERALGVGDAAPRSPERYPVLHGWDAAQPGARCDRTDRARGRGRGDQPLPSGRSPARLQPERVQCVLGVGGPAAPARSAHAQRGRRVRQPRARLRRRRRPGSEGPLYNQLRAQCPRGRHGRDVTTHQWRDVQPDRATVVLDAILRANLLHLHRRPLGRQARLPPCGGQRRSTECHRHPL